MESKNARNARAKKQIESQWVAIDSIAPHPRNTEYHAHPDAQIDMLAQSGQTFGQYKNVVIWKKQIIAGAGIWAGLKRAGATEIEVKDYSHLTQAQAFALMTSDNETQKGAVTNDAELAALVREVLESGDEALARLAAGEQKALDALLAQANKQEETADVGELIDKAAELQKKWQVERGDVWEIESKTAHGKCHRLMCGDSTSKEDVATLMGGEKANLVFTDPPYGVEYEGGLNKKKREKLQGDDSGALYFIAMDNCARFSEMTAPAYLWFADRGGKPVYDAVYTSGYKVRAMIVWNKIDAHYGNFMAQYMQKHEPCLYVVRDAPRWVGATNEVTVWDLKQPSKNDKHPTEKPLELALRAIGNHDARIVADWFCGSGTTLVACEQTGRIGRGMEIEPKYCAVTLERMSLLGLTPKRVESGDKVNGTKKLGANTEARG